MTCESLREMFAPEQLEERFGGTAPNREDPVWPPKLASKHCHPEIEKLMTKEEYKAFKEENPMPHEGVNFTEQEIVEIEKEEQNFPYESYR